ncbi:MAG TPA: ABC transporter permease [Candidatus Angelobacter sp.]|jgi:predicted permease|nr:ABC transporter permease [Candidatus Angelobacter sp.]
MADFIQHLRYALRNAFKAPGHSSLVVLALAIGIGVNTAIFSLANAAFFRPLPYPHADRLAFLWQSNIRTGETEGRVSYPNFADWKAQNQSFEDMAVFVTGKSVFAGAGDPERISGALVSANFFSVMGLTPLSGRVFSSDEQRPGHANVILISYRLWQTRFGSDPHVIGRTVNFGQDHNTIVGVLPSGFNFPSDADTWIPRIVSEFTQKKARQYPNLQVVGRLKPGVSWKQAQTEMDTIGQRLAQEYPAIDGGVGVRIVPFREQFSENVRQGLLLLWAAISAVLLIACLNAANLIVARSTGRHKEIALRLALGASRGHILRQLLYESLVLASAGAGVGLLFASWIVHLAGRLNPAIARLSGNIFDRRVLGYTLALTVLTTLVCGVLPSFSFSRMNLNHSLKSGGASGAPSGTQTLRSVLIVAEVSLAFVLLIGSGLLVRSLWNIFAVSPGFDATHVLTFHIYWPNGPANSTANQQRNAVFTDFLDRLRALPGVVSVGATSNVLFPPEMYKVPFVTDNQSTQSSGERPFLPHGEATPEYFQAMGIPLLRGRFFEQKDLTAAMQAASIADTATGPVAIINETMARRYWPESDPTGHKFRFDDPNFKSPWFTIVGVVGDVRQEGLEKSAGLMVYLPSSGEWSDDTVIRTTNDPLTLVAAIREQIRALDRNLAVDNVRTVRDLLSQQELQRQFNAMLLGGLAAIALLLSALGIYASVSYWVRQRTREIGIRMALGAQRAHVFELVVWRGMSLILIGLGFGLAGALAVTRFMSSLLYNVRPSDPLTFVLITLLLAVVALMACYSPARRAIKIDPLEALRYE